MKWRWLAGLLLLGALAAASAGGGELAPSNAMPIREGGSGRLVERPEIAFELLEALNARLAAAKAVAEIEAAIAELAELLKELQQAKQNELAYQKQLKDYIQSLKQDLAIVVQKIKAVQQQIDDLPWLPGEIGSVLAAKRAQLEDDLDDLNHKRSALEGEIASASGKLKATEQRIATLEQAIASTRAKYDEARAKKKELLQQQKEVAVTAPAEGARLLVGKPVRLQLRSLYPPTSVRVEIQRRDLPSEKEVRSVNDPPQTFAWRSYYAATWSWDDLESAGPLAAALVFDTGNSDRQLVQAGRGARPMLSIGQYRARVASGSEGWRTFSVVGRLDSKGLEKLAPVRPGPSGPGLLGRPPGQPPSGRADEASGSETLDAIDPSVLRRPPPH